MYIIQICRLATPVMWATQQELITSVKKLKSVKMPLFSMDLVHTVHCRSILVIFFINPLMVLSFKTFQNLLTGKMAIKCMNLSKPSIIFCYCTTTPFNTL